MNKQKVLAKFIGNNLYLENKDKPAYENGNYYVIIIGNDNGNAVEKQDGIDIYFYNTVKSFITDWTDIKHIKE